MRIRGFTLIELIIVIVILAILAIAAAPRFFNFTRDANQAALQGLQGNLRSAVELAYLRAAASGLEHQDSACLEGIGNDCSAQGILLASGYPIASRQNMQRLLDLDDWVFPEITSGSRVRMARTQTLLNNDCYLAYSYDNNIDTIPVIEISVNGC